MKCLGSTFVNFRFCISFLLLGLVSCNESLFYTGSDIKVSKVTRSLLNNLNNCQLQICFWPNAAQIKLDISLAIMHTHHPPSHLQTSTIEHVTETHDMVNKTMDLDPEEEQEQYQQDSRSWERVKHVFQQKSNCFSHISMFENFPKRLQLRSESWKFQSNYVILFSPLRMTPEYQKRFTNLLKRVTIQQRCSS